MMGGIPTDYHGQVVAPDQAGREQVVSGLFAAGECACVSVHGANRLGCNSLLDLLVFGRSAGERMVAEVRADSGAFRELPRAAGEASLARLARLDSAGAGEKVSAVGADLRRTMQLHCGVFRFPDSLAEGVRKMLEIAGRAQRSFIGDKSKVFNTARVEALELDNLVEVALATMISAEARKESRGAHDRSDYHERDDVNWLKHSLWYKDGNRLAYKPVKVQPLTVAAFEPKARVY
jgi:succinate dehydrogenase / fumarate reductase flavoprotein subunit